jgi:hypothetical protein
VYEVKRQLNNLYWQSEIYFGTKNDAQKYIKQKEKSLSKLEPRYKIEPHEISKLK